MPWDFGQDGNELSVRVSGQWTFNTMGMTRAAALAGSGLAWLPEDQVQPMLDDGRLQSVLDDCARTSMATTRTTRRAATSPWRCARC
jgi:DNA-binding transcriptional LysR family regulator